MKTDPRIVAQLREIRGYRARQRKLAARIASDSEALKRELDRETFALRYLRELRASIALEHAQPGPYKICPECGGTKRTSHQRHCHNQGAFV